MSIGCERVAVSKPARRLPEPAIGLANRTQRPDGQAYKSVPYSQCSRLLGGLPNDSA